MRIGQKIITRLSPRKRRGTSPFALTLVFVVAFATAAVSQSGACVNNPFPGARISGHYGEQRATHQHAGIDYAVPCGTAIPVCSGCTMRCEMCPNCSDPNGYGNRVYITNPNGYTEMHAHIGSCNAATNTATTGGARGAFGSGSSRGCHSHYEVRNAAGQRIDPDSAYCNGPQPPMPPAPPMPPQPPQPPYVTPDPPPPSGGGGGCDNCGCEPCNHNQPFPIPPGYTYKDYGANDIIRGVIRQEHQVTTDHILEEFEDQEEFLVNEQRPTDPTRVWGGYLLPALMMMTEQLVHTAMHQMVMLGSMLDAKQALETQLTFQKLVAEAHQDYQPSVEMCTFGTNVRSLAAAERNAEFTTFAMSQRSLDRQLGNMGSSSARGQFDDHCFRLKQFRQHYCDLKDNNEHMELICDPNKTRKTGDGEDTGGTTVDIFYEECVPAQIEVTEETKDKDISFGRTVDRANTLEIDMYKTGQTEPSRDEEDLFALAGNLYSHDIMYRMPETAMRERSSQDELLDMRTIIAKRSVAEHSFNTIVGMRAQGKEESKDDTYPYMKVILEQLGLDEEPIPDTNPQRTEMEIYLGDRPSYYAQMGVLTKRIYQSPDFFTNLYDEPVNIERKGAAMQAIGLMQDFDTWQSYLRTEAMLSVILELELLRLNNQVENLLGSLRSGGIPL